MKEELTLGQHIIANMMLDSNENGFSMQNCDAQVKKALNRCKKDGRLVNPIQKGIIALLMESCYYTCEHLVRTGECDVDIDHKAVLGYAGTYSAAIDKVLDQDYEGAFTHVQIEDIQKI